MGLEAATFIHQLVASNPVGATDPKSQGDDHIRLLKSTIQATFAAITGAVAATHGELNQLHAGVLTSLGSGVVGAPTYSFAGNTNTGFWRSAANQMSWSVNGALAATLDATQFFFATGVQLRPGDGAVGSAAYSFDTDRDTGYYRLAANNAGFAAGGALVFQYDINAIYNLNGTVGIPAYTFTSDPDSGLYRIGANRLGVSLGGALIVDMAATAFQLAVACYVPDGGVGAPAYSFGSDSDIGLYRAGANDVRMAANGAVRAGWDASNSHSYLVPHLFFDGAVGAPGQSWESDTNTGFYRDTADQIAIALGGVTAGQIAQGTFVATLTGCTTAPTVTVEWQRIGNIVHLYIPGVSATSNLNACTLSGVPAVIRPATHRTGQVMVPYFNDNGVLNTSLVGADVDTAGNIAFYKSGSLTGFTAVNAKGPLTTFEMQYKLN